MKCGVIAVCVILVATSIALAGDLNPVSGTRAGAISVCRPSTMVTGDKFKKLWDNCDAILSQAERNVISTDDGNWWTYNNPNHRIWDYMIVKFHKAGGCNGTCYWQVKLASQGVVSVYRWDHRPWGAGGQRWVFRSSNNGGSSPPTKNFSVSTSHFNGEGNLFLLIEGMTSSGQWWMRCDVCDIHY